MMTTDIYTSFWTMYVRLRTAFQSPFPNYNSDAYHNKLFTTTAILIFFSDLWLSALVKVNPYCCLFYFILEFDFQSIAMSVFWTMCTFNFTGPAGERAHKCTDLKHLYQISRSIFGHLLTKLCINNINNALIRPRTSINKPRTQWRNQRSFCPAVDLWSDVPL